MDLKEYYFNNIQEDEYHFKYFEDIKNINKSSGDEMFDAFFELIDSKGSEFRVHDEEDAISKFKELCQPGIERYSSADKLWFYFISYYLYKTGYVIEEFPRLLARPPLEPSDFTYTEIRNKLISEGKDDNGTVRFDTRRAYIESLNFVKRVSNINIDDYLNQKFEEISTRQASFNEMSQDEKLKEITNLIEHFLKTDGKFMKLDYSSISFEFITDEMVTKFRRKMQCFRHATEDTIKERNAYSAEQKDFFVDYGLTIVKVIVSIKKQIE